MKAKANPFRSYKIEHVPYFLQACPWDKLMEKLKSLSYRVAILGAQGRGKTTLLESLAHRLENRGWKICLLYFCEERRRLSWSALNDLRKACDQKTLVFVDGAGHMPHWFWKAFVFMLAHSGGLIITTHREGMLSPLIRCETDHAILRAVLRYILNGQEDQIWDLSCRLFEKYNGNIRDVLRDLYECCPIDPGKNRREGSHLKQSLTV